MEDINYDGEEGVWDDEIGAVACCVCGIPIEVNPTSMCPRCLQNRINITEDIPKQYSVSFCNGCGSYLQPPAKWIYAERESSDLLQLLLKKMRGLKSVKLIDSQFVWTEPHSKRLEIKLTVQKEVMGSAVLEQSFLVMFVVENTQCPNCAREYTDHTWKGLCQVRQSRPDARVFFQMEQMLLKARPILDMVTHIEEDKYGINFYFGSKSDALKFIAFLNQKYPLKHELNRQLVSADFKNNTYNYKYTFLVDLVPLCRNDLLWVPKKIKNRLPADCGPLVLVSRVAKTVSVIDPVTCSTGEIRAADFWKTPFRPLLYFENRSLTNFFVVEAQPDYSMDHGQKFLPCDIECMRDDFDVSESKDFSTSSHLGRIVHSGDIVRGYDLTTTEVVDDELNFDISKVPDVILVKKVYVDRPEVKRIFKEGESHEINQILDNMKFEQEWADDVINPEVETELEMETDAIDDTEMEAVE
ncbi:hypothetical protein PCE1_003338 [Barthelona sp. PCE]